MALPLHCWEQAAKATRGVWVGNDMKVSMSWRLLGLGRFGLYSCSIFRTNYSHSLSAINSFKERDLAKGIVFSSEIASKRHVYDHLYRQLEQ